jgi:hypothetical protein
LDLLPGFLLLFVLFFVFSSFSFDCSSLWFDSFDVIPEQRENPPRKDDHKDSFSCNNLPGTNTAGLVLGLEFARVPGSASGPASASGPGSSSGPGFA